MKSTFTHSTKLLVLIIISLFSLTNYTFSQTFPDASSCTSKDLELVGAVLSGGDLCNSCPTDTQITRSLTVSINNTTGSTRTAFAFWGTLEEYSGSDGFFGSQTGTPTKIVDGATDESGNPFVESAQDIRFYLRYRY